MSRDHAADMADLKRQLDGGKKRAFLDAIYVCVCSHPEKPVPKWAKDALSQALYDVMMVKATSWDDVFGKPHPRRKIANLRKQRAKQWELFQFVQALRRQRPKPEDPLQMAADKFKVGRATAKRWSEHVQATWFSKPPTF